MRTIAIANQKGGVGKTVTAINLASILAKKRKKVLLIDADSQHNLTDFFGVENGALEIILQGHGGCYDEYIDDTNIPGLQLIGGSDGLMYLDISALISGRARKTALRDLFCAMAEDDAYDFVIVDCPPAFNAASTAAFSAVDEVVIPMRLDAFSAAGMKNILRQVGGLRKINSHIRIAGLLLTMTSSATADRESELRSLIDKQLPVFRQTIRRSDRVDGMTFSGNPLSNYSPRSGAGIDYRKWVAEYIFGGEKNG